MLPSSRDTLNDLWDFARGIWILARSGRWFFALYIAIEVIGGLTPAIIYGSLAIIIAQIGALDAGALIIDSSLVLAVAAICAVIIINEVFWAWQEYLRSVIEARFATTVNTRLLQALFGLNDMAQREEPKLADQIQIAQSASSRLQPFINTLSNLWVWSTTAISCALLISQISPWIALMIVLTSLPAMLVNWRRASHQNQAERSESNRLRQAAYSYDLAFSRSVGVEMRIFGFGAWLIQRQQRLWQGAMQSVFREINKSMLYGFGLLALQIGLAVSSLGWLLYLYQQGGLATGEITAAILAIVTLIETMLSLQQVPSQIRSSSLFLSALFQIEQRSQQAGQARAQSSQALLRQVLEAPPGTGLERLHADLLHDLRLLNNTLVDALMTSPPTLPALERFRHWCEIYERDILLRKVRPGKKATEAVRRRKRAVIVAETLRFLYSQGFTPLTLEMLENNVPLLKGSRYVLIEIRVASDRASLLDGYVNCVQALRGSERARQLGITEAFMVAFMVDPAARYIEPSPLSLGGLMLRSVFIDLTAPSSHSRLPLDVAMIATRIAEEDRLFEFLNTASEAELDSVPGIGPAKIQQIFNGRPFTSAADLRRAGLPTSGALYQALRERALRGTQTLLP